MKITFEQAAKNAGWRLDTSCATETSNHIWWWNQDLLMLRKEEFLREHLRENYDDEIETE